MATVERRQRSPLKKDDLIGLYRALRLPRMIEERMLALLRQGRLSKWFSGIGQEAISVGATVALNADDIILPMHRNLGVFTTREVPLNRLFRQLMGKDGGYTRGRDRSFHFGIPDYHIIGMISHLAAMMPVADGLGLAFQLQKKQRVALSFVGDGATSEGDFHEALNLAAVWKLPVIFLIENNGYGLSTPNSEQFACQQLADRGQGYGIPGIRIDGNDVLEVHQTISEAAGRARSGKGPTLIEALTFRMRGHEEASGTKYVPQELFESWRSKDPILRFETQLQKEGLLKEDFQEQLNKELAGQIEKALEEALAAPLPKSTVREELGGVYAPAARVQALDQSSPQSERRYVDAVSDGLRQAMEADESVLVLGQDVAEYGGVFKVTQGFTEQFGKERVRNTPIIESAAVGAAMGLALENFKPVVEMQFSDFVSCGFNQIVNNLAKTHYRWGSPINVTLRLPSGGGFGAGPFHSQNPEGWFFQVPGLKIVAPATPTDAKGLLMSAIKDPNPVLVFEHKGLYRSVREMVPEQPYDIEIGKARIAREGSDLTLITYGLGVYWALEAAELLANEDGSAIEVLDLRSLLPWDREAVAASTRKTGRVLLLHEASINGSISGEIAAWLSESCFEYLDAPIARLGSLDIPTPFSLGLEQDIFWPKNRLVKRLQELLGF